MNRLKNDFIEFSKDNHLFSKEEGVQIACSGGSDSVAMLLLLNQTKDLFGVKLHCAHVDHVLRENSGDDASFVKKLCQKLNISFTCLMITEKPLGNLENWAREKRHELLVQNARELKLAKTALAHNANDRAETLLHNIARGAGLDGAANMEPMSGMSVRPLLFAQKAEILDFLSQM
ncbi:MAG: tRNA lysidine(34) synthetase TilS, partial [Caldiserica bacterium]|nr:tRNA lysidine(34) synthetase TilS [Caldisericota bacterium]